ncbi:MAG: ACT domain-containing protein [Candidatus Omnitrophica bacterium]|nr:ACT domain-containing protein [Candidatus Omnitrophota bacterium]
MTKALTLEMQDKVGLFADITNAMAAAGVNIISLCAYGMEGKAHCMMVTADNAKARRVAEGRGWKVSEHEVVLATLKNEVGAAQKIADAIKAANINLDYTYCTACSCEEGTCSPECLCQMVLYAKDQAEQLLQAVSV